MAPRHALAERGGQVDDKNTRLRVPPTLGVLSVGQRSIDQKGERLRDWLASMPPFEFNPANGNPWRTPTRKPSQ